MEEKIQAFQEKIWDFYHNNKRDFPWRNTTDPYSIMVSEIMLQQTQTSRVIEKYLSFINRFPDTKSLAGSSQPEVLKYWQGLGYNRRALYLKRAAESINASGNLFPQTIEDLEKLPGIGKNTAGAIVAFAYNRKVVFIETNIRRVFIHEFFKNDEEVSDKQILPLIESSLPNTEKIIPREEQQRSSKARSEFTSEVASRNPEGVSRDVRNWFYALMDYGAFLPKVEKNPNHKSKHYTKQSKFEGSIRQSRGKILKFLLLKSYHKKDLEKEFEDTEKFEKALGQLIQEGFVVIKKDKLLLQS